LSKGGEFAELGEIEFHFARDLFDGFDLRSRTDAADR